MTIFVVQFTTFMVEKTFLIVKMTIFNVEMTILMVEILSFINGWNYYFIVKTTILMVIITNLMVEITNLMIKITILIVKIKNSMVKITNLMVKKKFSWKKFNSQNNNFDGWNDYKNSKTFQSKIPRKLIDKPNPNTKCKKIFNKNHARNFYFSYFFQYS